MNSVASQFRCVTVLSCHRAVRCSWPPWTKNRKAPPDETFPAANSAHKQRREHRWTTGPPGVAQSLLAVMASFSRRASAYRLAFLARFITVRDSLRCAACLPEAIMTKHPMIVSSIMK